MNLSPGLVHGHGAPVPSRLPTISLDQWYSDSTNSASAAGALWERSRHVLTAKRRWISRGCSATRILCLGSCWEWAVGRKSWPALCICVLLWPFLLPPAWYIPTIPFGSWSRKVGGGTWDRTSSSDSHHSSRSPNSKLMAVAAQLTVCSLCGWHFNKVLCSHYLI